MIVSTEAVGSAVRGWLALEFGDFAFGALPSTMIRIMTNVPAPIAVGRIHREDFFGPVAAGFGS